MTEPAKTLENLADLRTKLVCARADYVLELGNVFHHKSALELAELSLSPAWAESVNDFVYMACYPSFQDLYERERKRKIDLRLTHEAMDKKPEEVIGFVERGS